MTSLATCLALLLLLLLPGCFAADSPPSLDEAAQVTDWVPSPVDRATDLAQVFTDERLRALIDVLAAYEQETSHQIAVLTVPDLGGETLEAFSLRVANSWGVGQSDADDGVLVTVSVGDRRARIEVGRGLGEVISDAVAAEIMDEQMIPAFERGDIQSGIERGVGRLMEVAR